LGSCGSHDGRRFSNGRTSRPGQALSQRRCDPRAQAYYAKKRAEGKTRRAAMRCLKRRLVDVLYRCFTRGTVESPVAVAA